jgi:hypothetical protein
VLSLKRPGQRAVVRFGYDAFPHPLPKLSLGGPKLFAIMADYEGSLLLFLLFLVFVCAHLYSHFGTGTHLVHFSQASRRDVLPAANAACRK